MPVVLSRQEIVEKAAMLPAFPRVVRAILETIENDTATIGGLAHILEQDPVIAGRVFSQASSAAVSMRPGAAVHGVAGATSMIGLAKVKEIALTVGVAQFSRGSGMSSYFWEHSVAVGVAAQELARYTRISTEYALISGLLHDIGQLWMARFYPLEFQMVPGGCHREPDGYSGSRASLPRHGSLCAWSDRGRVLGTALQRRGGDRLSPRSG